MTSQELRTLSALIALDFQDMYLKWGQAQPPRTGLHASSLLVSENEWCPRKHVLLDLFPEKAQTPELKQWQWKQQNTFLHGWELHRKWQYLFKEFGNVVYNIMDNVQVPGVPPYPELDLTHYDEDRHLYFSPDAILHIGDEKLVVEIKGINHAAFESLTDNLSQAMQTCETVEKAVIQANLYMHLLELKHAIILIENKNNQEFRVWITEYDHYLALPYVQRAYSVKAGLILARNNDRFAKRVCATPEDARAKKCPMHQKCFGMER